MTNHNKKTHDSLQRRVSKALREDFGYSIEENVFYPRGELDIVRYDLENDPIAVYEVKSNDTDNNIIKAYTQVKRFINYEKGTINVDKMDKPMRGIYISQYRIGGPVRAERLV